MKFIALFLLILIIFAISVTLGANNDQVVTFNYLLDQGQFRLSTLLALLLGTGFVLGWLLTGIFYVTTKLKLIASIRKIKKLEKLYDIEVANNRKNALMVTDNITPTQD